MADFTPLPTKPLNADLAKGLVEIHVCLEGARAQIAEIATEQLRVRQALDAELEQARDFRHRAELNQEVLLAALKIERPSVLDKIPATVEGKSLATMSQIGAGWRIAGVVFSALIAAPLVAKMVEAAWVAVSAVLLK